MLGDDCKFFELDLFNVYASAGNSLFSLYDIEQIGTTASNEQSYLNRKLDKARKRNTLYFGTDLNLLNTAIRIPLKNNSTITAVNAFITKLQKEIEDLSARKDNLEDENAKS